MTRRKNRGGSGKRRDNPYRRPDHHAKAAKSAGYVARSVFKLEEIDRRVRLLKQGQRVLDLGAAPGSWSAYAVERVGSGGCVVAIDLKPLKRPLEAPGIALVGDVMDHEQLVNSAVGENAPYHVVLSDMAPNTTGDRKTDQLRSMALFMRALGLAGQWLAPGGSFVGKLFMSGDFAEAREAVRRLFDTARTIRPAAVRDVSYEVYLVGLGLRAPDPAEGPADSSR